MREKYKKKKRRRIKFEAKRRKIVEVSQTIGAERKEKGEIRKMKTMQGEKEG